MLFLRRVAWLGFPLLAVQLSAQSEGGFFEDISVDAGLTFRHQSSKTPRKYLPETMSGGVALLDYDQDGRLDVFFVNGARLDFPHASAKEPDKSDPKFWNRLYRNVGDGSFRDVTAAVGLEGLGYGMGAAVGDIDNDGDPDLAVTLAATGEHPAVRLYRNEGGEQFSDITASAGLESRGWATSAGFFDYDNDGDLDLFVARYMHWDYEGDYRCGMETTYGRSYCHPDLFKAIPSQLFRNDGSGAFTDVSEASGIAAAAGKGLGVAFADFNDDGWMDVAVANDSHPQYLFQNEGDGSFTETGLFAGIAYNDDGEEFAGMGVVFEDLDDDSRPDLVITTLSQQRYAVFYNLGDETFEYWTGRSELGRITQLLAGWGAGALDFDNDGAKDLFFANGHVMDNIERSQPEVRRLQSPLLLRHRNRRFEDVSGHAGAVFQQAWAGRGAALGDLDNDGAVDIVVSNLDATPYLARNRAEGGNWVGFKLRGCASNRDAIGARIALTGLDGSRQFRTVSRAGSYLSSHDPRVFFGLGEAERFGSVEIRWPSGVTQKLDGAPGNRIVAVVEPSDDSVCR